MQAQHRAPDVPASVARGAVRPWHRQALARRDHVGHRDATSRLRRHVRDAKTQLMRTFAGFLDALAKLLLLGRLVRADLGRLALAVRQLARRFLEIQLVGIGNRLIDRHLGTEKRLRPGAWLVHRVTERREDGHRRIAARDFDALQLAQSRVEPLHRKMRVNLHRPDERVHVIEDQEPNLAEEVVAPVVAEQQIANQLLQAAHEDVG